MKRILRVFRRVDVSNFVPDKIRSKHARKFFVGVLVVMLVTGTVGALSYANMQTTMESQVQNQVTSTAELQADGLNSWINGMKRQTKTLSQAKQFQNGNEQAIGLYLLDQAQSLDASIVAVHYMEVSSSEVLASTSRDDVGMRLRAVGANYSMETVDAKTNRPSYVHVVKDPYVSPVSDERVIAFISSPPKNTQHAVVIVASLNARANSFYQTMDGGETVVTDTAETTILDSRENGTEERLDRAAIVGKAAANGSGYHTAASSVVGFAPVEGTDWVVMSQVPKSSAFAMRDAVGATLLAVILTTMSVLGVAAVGFGRRQTRTLEDLTESAEEMERGNLDVELESDRIDEFGQLYDAFDAMRQSLRETIDRAETAKERAQTAKERSEEAKAQAERERSQAQEAREEAERLNEHLEAKAEEFREVMDDCADGDLTRRLSRDESHESMDAIAAAYNEMMDELEATIHRVRAFSREVTAASETVTASVEEVTETGETVSESVHEISEGATRQHDHLTAVTDEMSSLSATAEEMAASVEQVAARTSEVAEKGGDGREAASEAIAELDEIEEKTEKTVEAVERLDEEMRAIENVVDVITDIADQTSLLAINASIEAARAGEAGSGFAVVADEVKALAEQTQAATGDIEESIESVRAQTETTVEDIHETREKVLAGSATAEEALAALDDIVDDVEETNANVQEISQATETQADSSQEVVSMVREVAAISEQTTAEAQEVAAASEEQTASLTEVADSVSDLAGRAEGLSGLLATFDAEQSADADAGMGVESEADGSEDAETGAEAADADGAPTAGAEPGPETRTEASEQVPEADIDADADADTGTDADAAADADTDTETDADLEWEWDDRAEESAEFDPEATDSDTGEPAAATEPATDAPGAESVDGAVADEGEGENTDGTEPGDGRTTDDGESESENDGEGETGDAAGPSDRGDAAEFTADGPLGEGGASDTVVIGEETAEEGDSDDSSDSEDSRSVPGPAQD